MNRAVLRAVLASLLILTVAFKMQAPADPTRKQLVARVVNVLAGHHLSVLEQNWRPSPELLPVVVRFEAPGCRAPVEVMLVNINLHEVPLFKGRVAADYTRLFAYLDRTWSTEDRLAMRLTWLKHKVLSILGLGRFVTITKVLLVASPPGCSVASGIDWSPVWDRHAAPGQQSRVPGTNRAVSVEGDGYRHAAGVGLEAAVTYAVVRE